ncbi:MAG: AmmeMemoRadiSam system protein B [Candidatus Omnitrophica bacterium]|nr:AmmeMemoRadiSam system protein B [Candidatus Omnitrophota bacterium]
MTREPVFAGSFYPSGKTELYALVEELMSHQVTGYDAKGAVSPHAGYIYSGGVAGRTISSLEEKETFVILGPNHTGNGKRFALSAESWRIPLGTLTADSEFVEILSGISDILEIDEKAHAREHSIEVQLPFLKAKFEDSRMVAICAQMGSIAELEDIALAINEAAAKTGRDIAVIASSDMSHYESRASASKKDKLAIECIEKLDPEGLIRTVVGKEISMCGVIPAAIMLFSAKALGACRARLIEYDDSGARTGDISEVVGYAGMVIT